MKRDDMKIGAVVASKSSSYRYAQPMTILDNQVWRRDESKFEARPGERCRIVGFTGVQFGYPVLTVQSAHRKEQVTALLETKVQLKDLLNADGTVNKDRIPEGLRFTLVNAAEMADDWAEHVATQKAAQEIHNAYKAKEETRKSGLQARFDKAIKKLRIVTSGNPFASIRLDAGMNTVTMSLAAFEALVNGDTPE